METFKWNRIFFSPLVLPRFMSSSFSSYPLYIHFLPLRAKRGFALSFRPGDYLCPLNLPSRIPWIFCKPAFVGQSQRVGVGHANLEGTPELLLLFFPSSSIQTNHSLEKVVNRDEKGGAAPLSCRWSSFVTTLLR